VNESFKFNLIDVGALGDLVPPFDALRPNIETVLAFEPFGETAAAENKIISRYAAWDEDSDARNFYIYGAQGAGSSLCKINYEWVHDNWDWLPNQGAPKRNATWWSRATPLGKQEVRTRRLDTIVEELRADRPGLRFHALKSDTQSGEGLVLKGATALMKSDLLYLQIETFRYPLYAG